MLTGQCGDPLGLLGRHRQRLVAERRQALLQRGHRVLVLVPRPVIGNDDRVHILRALLGCIADFINADEGGQMLGTTPSDIALVNLFVSRKKLLLARA